MSYIPNTLLVKVRKSHDLGLGFAVNERPTKPHVMISEVFLNGPAKETGQIYVGDSILRINDIDVRDMTFDQVADILKNVVVDETVTLFLKGPEGSMTHLETIFLDNGTPRTVRVTKPIPNESFVNRLKRTFGPSVPSAVNPIRRFYHMDAGKTKKNNASPKKEPFYTNDKTSSLTSSTSSSSTTPKRKTQSFSDGSDIIRNGSLPVDCPDRSDVNCQTRKNIVNTAPNPANAVKETVLEDSRNGSPKITLTAVQSVLGDPNSTNLQNQISGERGIGGGGGGGGDGGGGGGGVRSVRSDGYGDYDVIVIKQEQDQIKVIMANEDGSSVSETIKDDRNHTTVDEKKSASVNDVVNNGTPTKSRSRSGSRHNLFCENTGRGSPERRGSSPVKYCKLKCYQTEKVTTDMLHLKSVEVRII